MDDYIQELVDEALEMGRFIPGPDRHRYYAASVEACNHLPKWDFEHIRPQVYDRCMSQCDDYERGR